MPRRAAGQVPGWALAVGGVDTGDALADRVDHPQQRTEATSMNVTQMLATIAAPPIQGEEPDPWWAVAAPLVLAGAVGVWHLVRYWRRRDK